MASNVRPSHAGKRKKRPRTPCMLSSRLGRPGKPAGSLKTLLPLAQLIVVLMPHPPVLTPTIRGSPGHVADRHHTGAFRGCGSALGGGGLGSLLSYGRLCGPSPCIWASYCKVQIYVSLCKRLPDYYYCYVDTIAISKILLHHLPSMPFLLLSPKMPIGKIPTKHFGR